MLGGIAQAEVNDQLKDLDESASQTPGTKWKGVSPSFGNGNNNNPIYQVFGQQQQQQHNGDFAPSRPKKNNKNVNNLSQQQKQNFPLMGSLLNLNKLKNAANANKQRNNNNNNLKNSLMVDYSNWNNQMNKKQRSELQGAPSNQQNVFVLRAVNGKNKHARDDRKNPPASISRVREPARNLSPPPPHFRPKIQPIF